MPHFQPHYDQTIRGSTISWGSIASVAAALTFLLCTHVASVVWSQVSIDVVYPKEGDVVTATDSSFIFGSVYPAAARVHVNGTRVRTYPNGAFLAYLPVERGEFVFDCIANLGRDSVSVKRAVIIPPYLISTPNDTFAIDTTLFLPKEDLELTAGDVLEVAFKGTPGFLASFSIPGLVENVSMTEAPVRTGAYWGEAVFGEGKQIYQPEVKGVYQGVYRIPVGGKLDSGRVHFTLAGGDGINVTAIAPGKVTILDAVMPRIAKLTDEMTVARTRPGLGYQLFLPREVKLEITGKEGAYYRAAIAETDEVWVPARSINLLPAGTPVPRSKISVVRTEHRDDRVAVRVFMEEKLPFKVEQVGWPSAIVLTIYGGISDTDWIRHDYADDFLSEIKWSQEDRTTYRLTILLATQQQWGYRSFYDGDVLTLEIRKPPAKFELKGKVICLDPGHGPDNGAIGPTRITERDANMALAQVLKEKFEGKGAIVYLTRDERSGVTLAARTKMAAYIGADLFLSLHYNALPDGVNPFRSHGSSTYYYHAQSRSLAIAIQAALLKKLKLPDYGLYYDNLAVCRITEMPSVLIEPAFIMHPDEEVLIGSARFRKQAASAIVAGVEAFYKQAKKR